MSCESCIAARQAVTASYTQALVAAKRLANETKLPVFILKENDQYTPSTEQQPNAIEAVLPDK